MKLVLIEKNSLIKSTGGTSFSVVALEQMTLSGLQTDEFQLGFKPVYNEEVKLLVNLSYPMAAQGAILHTYSFKGGVLEVVWSAPVKIEVEEGAYLFQVDLYEPVAYRQVETKLSTESMDLEADGETIKVAKKAPKAKKRKK